MGDRPRPGVSLKSLLVIHWVSHLAPGMSNILWLIPGQHSKKDAILEFQPPKSHYLREGSYPGQSQRQSAFPALGGHNLKADPDIPLVPQK